MQIGFKHKYTRDQPATAKQASRTFMKELKFDDYNDCKSIEQLKTITNVDCAANPNWTGSAVIR